MGIVPSHRVRFDSFEIDGIAGELYKGGAKIRLQEQPFQILQILLEHPGELISREEIRKRVWPSDTFVDFDHGINNAIKRLREALGDTAETPRYVETLPRRGYRFIGQTTQSVECIQTSIPCVAVLPLENLSREPEQEYFADGLTEALITSLAKIRGLHVISRTTAMKYKGVRTKSVPEIAREIGVDRVVEGTVLRSGDRVRISLQLIDAPRDTHLWAESYDRNLRDVLALQAEVARAVAREIQVKLTPQEQAQLARSRQVDPEAYEAYLKGRYYLNKRTPEAFNRGQEYFQRAIERDPTYAAAHAGLADTASRLGFYGYVNPQEGCARGKAAALKAIELDDSSSEAHAALGFSLLHHDYAFAAAEAECRRAVELDPQNPWAALALAVCLITTTRFDDGIAEAMRLVHLDPISPLQWAVSGILYHCRRYDQAIAQAMKCVEMENQYAQARWTIAISLAAKGGPDRGIPELEKVVVATDENQFFLGTLGYCYAKAERSAESAQVLKRMRDLAKQRYISGFWQAAICGALGKSDEAFDLLTAAYREHEALMVYARVAPFFDELRSDRRFDDLLRSLNFPAT
jgi:TolB-like protein